MKSIGKIAVLFIAFNMWTMITPQKATAQVSINFQVFYDDLSPYGSWVLNSHYGYVWIPDAHPGFIPYGTNGHWVFTNMGWTWVSNYQWGWAPFHYGRWYFDYMYGWIWVPDYEWGPAWVVWRRSEGYYGWAPIGPGISINIAYGGSYNLPSNQWILVRDRDLGRTNINNYYIQTSDNSRILKNSTVINNIRTDNSNRVKYGIGPNRNEVEKRIGNTLKTVAIKERNKPGQNMDNGNLYVYKPRVEKHTASGKKPIPYKVLDMKDVKHNTKTNPSKSNERSAQKPQQQSNKQNNKQQQQRDVQPQKQNQGQQQQRKEQPVPQPQKQNQGQQQQRNEYPVPQPQKQNQGQQQQQPVPQPQQQSNPQQQPQKQNHGQQQQQPAQQPQQQNNPQQQPQNQNHGQQQQQQHPQKNH